MDDYVDVAERIRNFADRFPEGSLQSELQLVGGGWLCKAFAYRSPSDERPGIGHAFEPVPGKTPYTKDSEAMNAETSAWGRAIVALGFETKKIASRQEVRARSGGGTTAGNGPGDPPGSTESKPAPRAGASSLSPAQKPDDLGLKTARADFVAPNLNADATDKQKNYVKALMKKARLTAEQAASIGDPEKMTKARAMEVIEKLERLIKNKAAA